MTTHARDRHLNGHASNGHHKPAQVRQPPSDHEKERGLIGAILHGHVGEEILDHISAIDFYDYAHQIIFSAIARLWREGITPDPLAVAQQLTEARQLDNAGGAGYLAECFDRATSANAKFIAGIIRDNALRRTVIHECQAAMERAYDPTCQPTELLHDIAERAQQAATPTGKGVDRFAIEDLIDQHADLYSPIVDGLFRQRETVNIISASKVGKSWLAYSLALSIATSRRWLARFFAGKGRVLLIDNELHRPTLAKRLKTVAEAMGITRSEYRGQIQVWTLRGKLRDIHSLAVELRRERGFSAVILDAKYRLIPPGASENDNAAETAYYNRLDQIAEQTGAAIINVHHSSKGSQSDKRVTDVGAGAGAQSRAADCHIVLREHEEDGVMVMEAAVRSFAPVEPISLRWQYPLWTLADGVAARLKGRNSAREKQRADDIDGIAKIVDRLKAGPATMRQLRDTGISRERLERLLGILQAEQRIVWQEVSVRGNPTREYRIALGREDS